MPEKTYESRIPVSPETLFAWHTQRAALERLSPPWAPVAIERFEGVRDGQQAELRVRLGPLRCRWIAEHHSYVENRQFADRQVQGPFAEWNHIHRMEPDGPDAVTLIDDISYELPAYGTLARGLVEGELDRVFAYRHRITQQDLRLHRHYNPEKKRLRVAISGASGLIGSHLSSFLRAGGHEVYPMVRSQTDRPDEIYWNYREKKIDRDKLEGLDALIHLAGENPFALRWTKAKRKRIYESRAEGTRFVSQTLAELDDPPKAFISTSASNYYDDHGSDIITEETPSRGGGFMAAVCRAWEEATEPAADRGIRTVIARMGVVMSPEAVVLKIMYPVFMAGLGGRVGRPDQYFPWIAIDDVLGAFYHLLMRDAVRGPVNITAPHPVTMKGLAEALGSTLRRPTLFPVPAPVMHTVMGEVAEEAFKSMRIVPKRLEQTGYTFLYPDLPKAFSHVLGRMDRM